MRWPVTRIVSEMEVPMSANPMFASASGFPQRTWFVLVNDQIPRVDGYCAFCHQKIEKGYVREPQARVLYCDPECFAERATTIMHYTRKVS
jgi:hypothetical protein